MPADIVSEVLNIRVVKRKVGRLGMPSRLLDTALAIVIIGTRIWWRLPVVRSPGVGTWLPTSRRVILRWRIGAVAAAEFAAFAQLTDVNGC